MYKTPDPKGQKCHQYKQVFNRRLLLEFPFSCSHTYAHSYIYVQIAMHMLHTSQNTLNVLQYRAPRNFKHAN